MLLEDPEFESAYGGTESRRHISLKANKRRMTARNTVNSKEYIISHMCKLLGFICPRWPVRHTWKAERDRKHRLFLLSCWV